ncbi:MAG: cytochrome C biogenesis protein [Thaumarchaeota archaeon]|nr:cytochrome C biogenesis protein [Nitrososphaerota archaeon]
MNVLLKILSGVIFILFSIAIVSVFFSLAAFLDFHDNNNISYMTWIVISYMAGLSMIVLPCTMPLVFIIIPLSIGHNYKKGLIMSLLFGIGLTITITAYGITIAKVGDIIALNDVSMFMFFIAGIIAFIFGLTQLKIINLSIPTYSGMPKFIENQSEFGKSFFMGLLLGNAGVGCPNPMFYWLLTYIASTGDLEIGATLGFVHGIGRAIPLILISIITILGINIKSTLINKRPMIEIVTGFMLIIIGTLLIINGIPGGHHWYEETVVHTVWNNIIGMTPLPSELMIMKHHHNNVIDPTYFNLLFLFLVLLPLIFFIKLKRYKGLMNEFIK